jgi:hypothetical protein
MAGEVEALSLVWDLLKTLVSGPVAVRHDFFKDHVEPLQAKMADIHKDYISGFQEIRRHLKDQSEPASDLIEFLKERRRAYDHERVLALQVANELEMVRKVGINSDLLELVKGYCESILKYFSASASMAGFTWYSGFIDTVETWIKSGYGSMGESVWREVGYSSKPREELLAAVDSVLDERLPQAFAKVSGLYALLLARLL